MKPTGNLLTQSARNRAPFNSDALKLGRAAAAATREPSCPMARTTGFIMAALAVGCLVLAGTGTLAQPAAELVPQIASTDVALTLDTEAVAPLRFIAAHGRRALVAGYASSGLEVWVYPFQIASGYQVQFRPAGATTAIPGYQILRRVTYEPDSVTRTYLGPGFIVHERISVPLDEPGAILTYKVEGSQTIEIDVHAIPVLDLMWPGAVGGQSSEWNSALSAFVLSEPTDGYSAVVGSTDIVAHDEIASRTAAQEGSSQLGFTLRPDRTGVARVYFALNPPHAADPGQLFRQLIHDRQTLEEKSASHSRDYLSEVLSVETPDAEVNRAISWSEVALDQAWVCNPDLGCGYVAGYGPSRGARRPQYDWFFAGDGLIAAEGSLAASDNRRMREELEFILRYQDRKTGMIWHELSQSAALIDWAHKFPYMFVHVDVTFQFLAALEHYVTQSGDTAFALEHWKEIEAAYGYCQSVIDPASGLPRIPSDKEGGDEQDRIADDLGLSTSWVESAHAYAHLANLTGHAAEAEEAASADNRARAAIPEHYWDAHQSFWIAGFNAAGQAAPERRSSPSGALTLHLFDPEQTGHLLDQLASSSFQTDWGTRSVEAGSAGYDAESYAKGSVWALGTASLAGAFWAEHRPTTAWGLWQALLPWFKLDSLGHMDEVLSGNYYRAQTEAVPEQTWSSAAFLDATVHGLLGLSVDSIAKKASFAPHLPAGWGGVTIKNFTVAGESIALALKRTPHGLTLQIDNSGPAFRLEFAPQIPLGAKIVSAAMDHRPVAAELEAHPQETDAHIVLEAPHGASELNLNWQGGVEVTAEMPTPLLGMGSRGVHVVGVRLVGNQLTIDADLPQSRASRLELKTDWEIVKVEGAVATAASSGITNLNFASGPAADSPGETRRAHVQVQFRVR